MMESISQMSFWQNLIGEDATKTKANVEAFTKLFNEAVNEIVKKKGCRQIPRWKRRSGIGRRKQDESR